jgi:hypothetical protein
VLFGVHLVRQLRFRLRGLVMVSLGPEEFKDLVLVDLHGSLLAEADLLGALPTLLENDAADKTPAPSRVQQAGVEP